jgi:hypothetical protein
MQSIRRSVKIITALCAVLNDYILRMITGNSCVSSEIPEVQAKTAKNAWF